MNIVFTLTVSPDPELATFLRNIMTIPAAVQTVLDSFKTEHLDPLTAAVTALAADNQALILAANQVLDAEKASAAAGVTTPADLTAALAPLQAAVDAATTSASTADAATKTATGTMVP